MSARSTSLGNSKPRLQGAVVGVVCAFIAACGGGSGGAAPPAADTTPPTALSSVPLNSASQVATQTVVSVTFSEAMDAANLSAATFTLSAAGAALGATVVGSVSVSGCTCGAAQKIGSLAGHAELPRLTGAPNGDAIVVWEQAEAGGGPRSIYAHHYSAAGASWGATPALIDANAGGAQIAMDKRGKATVV